MKKIITEDENGTQLVFTYDSSPIRLVDTDGFSTSNFIINTSKNSNQDGETFNSSYADKRNLVITVEVFSTNKADYIKQRNKLYSFFQPRKKGTIYYFENDMGKKAYYYVEKVAIEESGVIRTATISLICPDPKFYALNEEITNLAVWEGNIRFPLKIPNLFKVTTKVNTLIGNVYNDSAVTQGLIIKFYSTGTVVNPSLMDVNKQQLMQVNITMKAGDILTITTGINNKKVVLFRDAIETNIINAMAYPPVWLQAYQGDNQFRYNAESGIDNLNVSILHTQAFWGA